MTEEVERKESRPQTPRSAVATAIFLFILDAFILGSPSWAVFTAGVVILWMIPRTLVALIRKEPSTAVRGITLAVYVVMAAASFSAYTANMHLAKERSDDVIRAVDGFHSKYRRYPKSLDEVVPEFLKSVPRANYKLLFGNFRYVHSEDKPFLMYYGWPPFQRLYYNFASKTRTMLD
ncbi:MAG: hypothetical protein V1792_27925 [Pseudomonadota bacterium]